MDWTLQTEGPQAINDDDLRLAFAEACPQATQFATETFVLLARIPATLAMLRDNSSDRCEPLPREATVTISGTTNPEEAVSISLTITNPAAPPPIE